MMNRVKKGVKAMISVAVLAALGVFGMSSSAHAIAIADALSTTSAWNVTNTLSGSFTVTSGYSESDTYSYSPVSGSYSDSDLLIAIGATSASDVVTEAQGSNNDAASTTAGHGLSASSINASHGDPPSTIRTGYTRAKQYLYFSMSGDGNVTLNIPYTLNASSSGTTISDYAYADAGIYGYLEITDEGGSGNGSRNKVISDTISGIGSNSKTFSGIAKVSFDVQNGSGGYLYVENWVHTYAYSPVGVPEPATLLLLGCGLLGLGIFGRKSNESYGS